MSEIAYYVIGDIACSIWKQDMGHLCGYIGLPPAHPWHGKWYDDIDAEVHGGLTFCGPEKAHIGISRQRREYLMSNLEDKWSQEEYDALPAQETTGREDAFPHDTALGLWWIGFDCAHSGDSVPGLSSLHHSSDSYKDEAYVRNEIDGLVRQATQAAIEVLP
jgi:hypothetical protein